MSVRARARLHRRVAESISKIENHVLTLLMTNIYFQEFQASSFSNEVTLHILLSQLYQKIPYSNSTNINLLLSSYISISFSLQE